MAGCAARSVRSPSSAPANPDPDIAAPWPISPSALSVGAPAAQVRAARDRASGILDR
ncbi:hypothetical protein [Saccharopolyspora sp. CA-218241]|uniref:hypothetical protein n=1 Tax=Saccharopolyspora sp. CA-218241 TaxID=3240027 RepID=UPI003D97F82D